MNDMLQIFGVVAICAVLAFSVTGKSPRTVISDAWQQNQTQDSEKAPTLLSIANYVPPAWLGENTAVQTDTNTVIDTNNETNSGTVFASNINNNQDRSDFKNSATNDNNNGEIIIAAKNTQRTNMTASVSGANAVPFSDSGISHGPLLLIVLMLFVLVVLIQITTRKKKQLRYRQPYSRPNPRIQRPQQYNYMQRNYQHR